MTAGGGCDFGEGVGDFEEGVGDFGEGVGDFGEGGGCYSIRCFFCSLIYYNPVYLSIVTVRIQDRNLYLFAIQF